MTFTDRLAYEIPPLLRGLTSDGQKGLFVHAVTGKKVDLMLSSVSKSMEETVDQWKRLLDAYTQERRLYPAVIGIEGTDFT
ncbi:MAG: sorbitol-6-phosphate 2-dehydrogenase, partial [Spirochaetia bacterium]|nr:sorbitol-6-phosphate 2-dehydrogenase [Spirochaetia bacterium]